MGINLGTAKNLIDKKNILAYEIVTIRPVLPSDVLTPPGY
jgi:hypothetical protein